MVRQYSKELAARVIELKVQVQVPRALLFDVANDPCKRDRCHALLHSIAVQFCALEFSYDDIVIQASSSQTSIHDRLVSVLDAFQPCLSW